MFRELMTYDQAKKLIYQTIDPKPLGNEKIPLIDAYSRILYEDIISNMDIPPFDRSTVDGYALIAEDTFGAEEISPIELKIIGEVKAGIYPKVKIRKGEAVEIVTGAPIPLGANAVIMIENTQKQKTRLFIYRAVTQGENLMRKGVDIKKDETILYAGKILEASDIGVIAALGLTSIKVFKIPTIAVISTGAEIIEPGKDLIPGKIYDINAYSLSDAILNSGGKPIFLGVIPDDEIALETTLKKALLSSDMIITSGGVSVGPKDYTPKVINSLGKPGVIISGIAVKPGKPTTVAVIGHKPVFSLPGHPTSALLIFYLLVSPIIQRIAGRKLISEKKVIAKLKSRLFSAKGRKTYVTVKLSRDKKQKLVAHPIQSGMSGAITTLSKADGFIEIPVEQQFIDSNEEVVVTLLTNKKV